MKTEKNIRGAGFTFVELLVTVAAIAFLAAVAVVGISKTKGGVENVKLRNDVEALNEAIQVYLANGGSMDGADTVPTALAKLKTKADAESGAGLVGISGSMLDPRIEAQMMSIEESSKSSPRALWDSDRKRFVYATSGFGGAKGFLIDETAAGEDPLEEARKTALAYGKMTNWVWDYEDRSLSASTGVEQAGDTTEVGGYAKLTPPEAEPLQPPSFSIEGGIFNFFDFDLEVELSNPNPVGVSNVYYSVDELQWRVYTGGAVTVGPGQTLTAYAVSLDPDRYENSPYATEEYESSFSISGAAGGNFMNPEGTDKMVTNLLDGDRDEFFSFGKTTGATKDPSWLLFNGADFADISIDESFLLGTIDYYNGTIQSGSGADRVGLSVDLTFNGGEQQIEFNYELDLISTRNLGHQTDEQNADYVKLGNLYSDVPVRLGGRAYDLILEFGDSTRGGFSSIDEFHVIEDRSASGQLFGRLIEVTSEEMPKS